VSDESKSKISRRRFVAGTVAGVAVGAALGVTGGYLARGNATTTTTDTSTQTTTLPAVTSTLTQTTTVQPWLPAKWDYTADVVVVGYGGAGAVAAISAHDAGANVLVLEKSPPVANRVNTYGGNTYAISGGGGNTCICGGGLWSCDSADSFAQALYQLSWGSTPLDVCQAFANVDANLVSWCGSMNIPVSPTEGPGWYTNIDTGTYKSMIMPGGGAQLFSLLDAQVQKRNITVMLGTPATGLIQNPTTMEILGVEATNLATNAALNIKANKAVVLCTGGFEFNETMKLNYLKAYPTNFWGWNYNTGDGITMAAKVGAGMWHMNCVSAALSPWIPSNPSPSSYPFLYPGASSWIWVNKHGVRYANEYPPPLAIDTFYPYLTDFDTSVPEYTRIPSFMIFDSTVMQAGALVVPWGVHQLPAALGSNPTWSSDNSTELAKGWIQTGATIADLASAINGLSPFAGIHPSLNSSNNTGPANSIAIDIDPNVLTETVNTYNGYCTSSPPKDLQFGRPALNLVPIQKAPFYAVAMWPAGPNTQGGPIRNAKGQVCTSEGNAIPRLYSNGELGSVWGLLYHGAGNITECLCYGQISGQNAAAETSWS
jgi:succinate dehydrogenase/fumarate reductase flavoprotein subunit